MGEGWCFLIDGISYFSRDCIPAADAHQACGRSGPTRAAWLRRCARSWDYVRTFQPVRTILLLFALISLMGYPYIVLMPVFAVQILHGDSTTLGWLAAATGVGALASGISLTLRKSVAGLTRMLQNCGRHATSEQR